MPFRPGAAQLIWRSPRTRRVRSIPMRRLLLAFTTIVVLLLTALVVSAAAILLAEGFGRRVARRVAGL